MGSILDRAMRDAKRYITSGGFESEILLSTPNGSNQVTLSGLTSKHHIAFDTDGNAVQSKTAHITIDENILISNDYPVRNSIGEVYLIRHRVSVKDSTGITKQYIITENFPDEALGLISCILADFK